MIWNLSNIGTSAASGSKYMIYVANSVSDSITLIDPTTYTTNTIILSSGSYPQGVALSLDGYKLYVSCRGNNVVYVINTKSNNVIKTISIPELTIFNIKMSPIGKLYAMCSNGNIVVIDTITDTVTNTILNTGKAWDITFSSFNGLAYSTGGSEGKIYVINYTTDDSLAATYTNSSNCGIVIDPISYTYISTHPKAGEVYFGLVANEVLAYNTYNGSSNNAFNNLATYTTGATTGNIGTFPQGLAISPDGNSVYVANLGSGDVTTLYPTNSASSIKVSLSGTGSHTPFGLFATSDGLYLYISNSSQNNVQIMDTSSHTIIKSISVGNNPLFIVGGYVPN